MSVLTKTEIIEKINSNELYITDYEYARPYLQYLFKIEKKPGVLSRVKILLIFISS